MFLVCAACAVQRKRYDYFQSNWRVDTTLRGGIMATFAERMKELRAKAGLSQSGLATKSGMSLGAIHDYEQGNREPSLRSAFKLADALGTDCRAFADCEDMRADAKASANGGKRPKKPARGKP
jgi:DNA-binding XRE family transcriptional regulator